MEPSFSMEVQQGRKKTSVAIFLGSLPGPRQKEPVSLSKRLTLTSHFSFSSAPRLLLALGPEQVGFMPHAKRPSSLPSTMRSKMDIHM